MAYNIGDVVTSWFAEGRCRENGVIMRTDIVKGHVLYGVDFPTAQSLLFDSPRALYWCLERELKPVRNWKRIRVDWIREEIGELIEKAARR